jgi:hypothetical protein
MSTKKQRTKGSHYVTKEYLNGFSYADFGTPESLWTYERKKEVEEPKPLPTEVLCKKNYLYETSFLKVNEIEDEYAELEGKFISVMKAKVVEHKSFTANENAIMKKFVNSMSHRTLSTLDSINEFQEEVISQMQSLADQYAGGKSKQLEEAKALKDRNFMFAHTNKLSLEGMGERFSDFALLEISESTYGEECFFVTSDNPVSVYDFTMMNALYGIPPMSQTSEITFPLNSKFCLFGNNIGITGYHEIGYNMVCEINNRTMNYSRKLFFAAMRMDERFINHCIERWRQSLLLNFLYP